MKNLFRELNDSERELVSKNINLVYHLWSRLANDWVKMNFRDDILAAGYLGLCKASQRFDPERGPFVTIACYHIRREISVELNKIKNKVKPIIDIDSPVLKPDQEISSLTIAECIPDPENEIERLIDQYDLEVFLKELPSMVSERELDILLAYANGKTYREIGKDFNISGARVGQLIRRVSDRIKKIYDRYETYV